MSEKLKLHKKSYYSYFDLEELVEKKTGKPLRDWAGWSIYQSSPSNYQEPDYPTAKWAIAHGYNYKVLNDPVDEDGMKLRIKINEEFRTAPDGQILEPPYQDFWHYAIDNIFYDVSNGCIVYFNPSDALESVEDLNDEDESQEWIKEILRYFIQVFEENNLPKEIEVEISW